MELLLDASEDPEMDRTNWDIDVEDGLAVCVPEDTEEDQAVAIMAYLETNTIPLMPERGVNWTDYLAKRKTLSEIDNQIRENLKTYCDTVLYSPIYTAEDGQLKVSMSKVTMNTGA